MQTEKARAVNEPVRRREVQAGERFAPQQSRESAEGEVRTERNGSAAPVAGEQDEGNSDDGANAG